MEKVWTNELKGKIILIGTTGLKKKSEAKSMPIYQENKKKPDQSLLSEQYESWLLRTFRGNNNAGYKSNPKGPDKTGQVATYKIFDAK